MLENMGIVHGQATHPRPNLWLHSRGAKQQLFFRLFRPIYGMYLIPLYLMLALHHSNCYLIQQGFSTNQKFPF